MLGLHDRSGSLGWTVNGTVLESAATIVRRTNLVPPSKVLPESFDQPARRGGPVSPSTVWLVYRYDRRAERLPGSILVGTEIAVTASAAALEELVEGRGPSTFRMLVGYAGWGPGQLAGELARGAWLPAAPNADLLFDGDRNTVWERAYSRTIGTVPQAFVPTRGLA